MLNKVFKSPPPRPPHHREVRWCVCMVGGKWAVHVCPVPSPPGRLGVVQHGMHEGGCLVEERIPISQQTGRMSWKVQQGKCKAPARHMRIVQVVQVPFLFYLKACYNRCAGMLGRKGKETDQGGGKGRRHQVKNFHPQRISPTRDREENVSV